MDASNKKSKRQKEQSKVIRKTESLGEARSCFSLWSGFSIWKGLLVFTILGLASQSLVGSEDRLKSKFVAKIQSIAENADAVVGVAIKDLKSGDEYLINADEIFPQASSIKIHILTELYRQAEQGRYRLTDILQLPESVRVGGSGILSELGPKSVSLSLHDYAVLMIVLSDNTATNLLIDLVGMQNVNKSLQAMGASKTKLQRVMMDVKAAKAGRENIGTPREAMMVLEKLHQGEIVSKKASEEIVSILRKPKEGPIRRGVPESVPVANKEGEVEGMRCDVAIVELPESPYIICVMTKLLLKPEDGPRVIEELSRASFQYFDRKANSNEFGRRIPR